MSFTPLNRRLSEPEVKVEETTGLPTTRLFMQLSIGAICDELGYPKEIASEFENWNTLRYSVLRFWKRYLSEGNDFPMNDPESEASKAAALRFCESPTGEITCAVKYLWPSEDEDLNTTSHPHYPRDKERILPLLSLLMCKQRQINERNTQIRHERAFCHDDEYDEDDLGFETWSAATAKHPNLSSYTATASINSSRASSEQSIYVSNIRSPITQQEPSVPPRPESDFQNANVVPELSDYISQYIDDLFKTTSQNFVMNLKWLKKRHRWPIKERREVSRFMHDYNVYALYEDVPVENSRLLPFLGKLISRTPLVDCNSRHRKLLLNRLTALIRKVTLRELSSGILLKGQRNQVIKESRFETAWRAFRSKYGTEFENLFESDDILPPSPEDGASDETASFRNADLPISAARSSPETATQSKIERRLSIDSNASRKARKHVFRRHTSQIRLEREIPAAINEEKNVMDTRQVDEHFEREFTNPTIPSRDRNTVEHLSAGHGTSKDVPSNQSQEPLYSQYSARKSGNEQEHLDILGHTFIKQSHFQDQRQRSEDYLIGDGLSSTHPGKARLECNSSANGEQAASGSTPSSARLLTPSSNPVNATAPVPEVNNSSKSMRVSMQNARLFDLSSTGIGSSTEVHNITQQANFISFSVLDFSYDPPGYLQPVFLESLPGLDFSTCNVADLFRWYHRVSKMPTPLSDLQELKFKFPQESRRRPWTVGCSEQLIFEEIRDNMSFWSSKALVSNPRLRRFDIEICPPLYDTESQW